MKVGDLVRGILTEQIGIILMFSQVTANGVQVLWTTQGLSLFGAGHKEWCSSVNLEALNESG